MILKKFTKQPLEVKDYDIDYSDFLQYGNDSIASATVTVVCLTTPLNTALVVASVETTAKLVKIWVSGGASDETYKVTVFAVTTGGRTDESELIFYIKDL